MVIDWVQDMQNEEEFSCLDNKCLNFLSKIQTLFIKVQSHTVITLKLYKLLYFH